MAVRLPGDPLEDAYLLKRASQLAGLRRVREMKGMSQEGAAIFLELGSSRGRDTVRKWELGEIIPPRRRRDQISSYLLSGLGLASDRAAFESVWCSMAGAWGWPDAAEAELEYHDRARLVDRSEQAWLEAEFAKVLNLGKMRFLLLGGDFGMGKTTLVRSFIAHALRSWPELVVAMSDCHTGNEGYATIKRLVEELVPQYATPRFGEKEVSKQVGERVKMANYWKASILSGLWRAARPCGGRDTGPASRQEVATQSKLRPIEINEQFVHLLQMIEDRRPMLLFIDNLHWADAGSLRLLSELVRRLADRPIYLVGTYRPVEALQNEVFIEVRTELQTSHPEVVEHRILEAGMDVNEFIRKRYVTNTFPEALSEYVAIAAGGCPMLINDIFMQLEDPADRIIIIDESGTARIKEQRLEDVHQLAVKSQALMEKEDLAKDISGSWQRRFGIVLDQRLALLGARLRRVIDHASIEWMVEQEFSAEILSDAFGIEVWQMTDDLRVLQETYRLVQEKPPTQRNGTKLSCYDFRHTFYGDYIYQKASAKACLDMHLKLARLWQQRFPDTASLAGSIAVHLRRANELPEAARYALEAARYQQVQSHWSAAEVWCQRGLDWIGEGIGMDAEGKTGDTHTKQDSALLRLELLEQSGQGFYQTEENEKADARYREALELAIALQADPRRVAQLYDILAATSYNMGQSKMGLNLLEQGLTVLREHGVSTGRLIIELESDRISMLDDLGLSDYEESALSYSRLLKEAAALDPSSALTAMMARIHNYRAIALGHLGQYGDAAQDYRRAIKLSEEIEDWRFAGICCLNIASDACWQDCPEEVEEPLDRGIALSTMVGARDSLNWAEALRGTKLLLENRFAEAANFLSGAIANAEKESHGWNLVGMYVDLSAAQLAERRASDARETARKAVALAEEDSDPATNGWALVELGRAESALANHAEALMYLRKALDIHRQAKQRHMAARAQGYLGQAMLGAGQIQQGVGELTDAIAMLEALKLQREANRLKGLLP